MGYPDALPHELPKPIASDVFVVHGCVKPNAVVRFTRNMTIVRENGQLTLINPVRMNEAGLKALEQLGDVAHVLRLGSAHGMDDPFYVDRYNAEFWSFEGGTTYTLPNITKVLTEGGPLPFPNAKLFAFKHTHQPEGAILLERTSERSQGLLLTCDAVQSYRDGYPQTNWLARRLLPKIGFIPETLIAKMWLKHAVTNQQGIQVEFKRLLTLDFDQLISAHGTFVEQGAHEEVKRAFENKFG